ncbi:sugar transferase [Frigoribacterium sp. 2-23]|uniref:sugar transferase n=1 Tax=Frigoribacterium sp. 2-23 TaxID=3415006 RepID=UPI003C6F501F
MVTEAPSTAEVRQASSTIGWSKAYARRLLVTDALVLIWVVFGVQIAWFGMDTANLAFRGNLRDVAINYTAVSLIVIVVWLFVLGLYGSRSDRVIGTGSTEYKLIFDVSLRVFGVFAIAAFLFHIDLARGYILIAFPLGTLTLIFVRWLWRQWLVIQRSQGRYSAKVLLVGSRDSVEHFARQLMSQPSAGYRVVGACLPGTSPLTTGRDLAIPVFGNFDELEAALIASAADTVVITSSDDLPPERVKELSWSLEPGGQHLVMAPSLTDIGGPRIHTRPVAGFPLIHVETPTYAGQKLFAKRLFDLIVGLMLVVLTSPILAIVALAVRLTSPGPVLFFQERIGLNGDTFRMFKFRSMVVDAEKQLPDLLTNVRQEGNRVLFKMKDDPRVTPVGAALRRFSLDELPQLFNVLRGDMALVGPRPPLAREVEQYELRVHRRFLVKPGITGLWQTSGRSTLSWEDSVRLDLFYVENWSMAGDLIILWRTLKAVLAKEGAF